MCTKLLIISVFLLAASTLAADVYVVIYATHDGKTGHAGIAIDKYAVKIRDCASCPGGVLTDTVKSGELLYYDLWPEKDRFDKQRLFDQVPGVFFRLPASSAENPITVGSLIRKGIPHEEGYACDALLKIKTGFAQDQSLREYLDELTSRKTGFQAIDYNCADFVEQALEFLLDTDLQADERVFVNMYATTPNQLYKALIKLPGILILKNPGNKINGSFWEEKMIKW